MINPAILNTIRTMFMFLPGLLLVLASGNHLQAAETGQVTIILPQEALAGTIRDVLPLPIPVADGHIEGSLQLTAVDRLEIQQDELLLQGLIVGRDLGVRTRVGEQEFLLRIGDMHLPFTCRFLLRFAPAEQVLYATPVIEPPTAGKDTSSGQKLSLASLLGNREYPLPLADLLTFTAQAGEKEIKVMLSAAAVDIIPGRAVVYLQPGAAQNR